MYVAWRTDGRSLGPERSRVETVDQTKKSMDVVRVRQGSKKRLIVQYAGVFLFFASSLNSLIDLLIN